MEIQRLLFLYERYLYFGRCYIVANFKLNTQYTLTVKDTQREFRNKFKMEGKHNYETILDYKDYNAKVYFGVDPLDAEKIKLLSKTEKFDMIFIINATKGLDIKESFKVCSLLLKNEGELHMLFNSTQYEALKVGDAAAAAGMYFKENKKVNSEYCTGLSLKHIKAPEDAVIYIFKLTPKTTPSLNQPTVGSESASQPQGETSRHGLQLLLEDEKVAPESNLKKVRKVDLLGSEKVKEELVLDGNDIEQKSHVKNKDS